MPEPGLSVGDVELGKTVSLLEVFWILWERQRRNQRKQRVPLRCGEGRMAVAQNFMGALSLNYPPP